MLRSNLSSPCLAGLLGGVLFALAPPAAAGGGCTPPVGWPTPVPIGAGSGDLYADLEIWPGSPEKLDVYLPTGWCGSQALPTLLFIHGGGSRSGTKSQPVGFFRRMLDFGYPVVSTDYRLTDADCATGAFPEAIHDVRAAADWIKRPTGASPAGQDVCLPTCIVAIGTSTGAFHAALLGVLDGANDGGLFDPGITGGDYGIDLAVMVSGSVNLYGVGAERDCPEAACYEVPLEVVFPAPFVCGNLSAGSTPWVHNAAVPVGHVGEWSGDKSGFPPGFPALDPADWAALPWGDELENGCWPPELFLGCQWGLGPCPQADPPPLPHNALTGNRFADVSPMNWVDAGDADFHIFHGICDFRAPFHAVEDFETELASAGMYVVVDDELTSDHGLSNASNALLGLHSGSIAIDGAITDWMAQGGCSGSLSSTPPGCEAARGSLRFAGGPPRPGAELVFAVDDPSGRHVPGARAFLSLSDTPFACAGIRPRGTVLLGAETWHGPDRPARLAVRIPADPALVGTRAYVQGTLVDRRPGGAPAVRTDVLRLEVGPPR